MHRTNVELDEKLIREGMRLFKKKTKKELIHFALSELIRREKAKGILDLESRLGGQPERDEEGALCKFSLTLQFGSISFTGSRRGKLHS